MTALIASANVTKLKSGRSPISTRAILSAVVILGLTAGCGTSENKSQPASSPAGKATDTTPQPTADNGGDKAVAGLDHSGWWCGEHGMPEDQCAQCNSKLAAEMKRKGDWCKKHDRPDSQCFVCHPELKGRFAALYEAKFGKQPPEPVEEEAETIEN